jgi:hypothetical protein
MNESKQLKTVIDQVVATARRQADWATYDCDGPTNEDRANWARSAWIAHRRARDGRRLTATDIPLGYEIADVICDLLHLAEIDRDGEDDTGGVPAALTSALGNYAAEVVHREYCRDCQGDDAVLAEAIAAVVASRIETPEGERAVVLGIDVDERDGDTWHVRVDGSGRLTTCRAEECHVLEDPEPQPSAEPPAE